MAQGSQTRLSQHLMFPKQFIKLNDQETIINRTLRLLDKKISCRTVLICRDELPWTQLSSPIVSLINPGTCLLEGIIQTQSLWTDHTIFLLGDVIYSKACIDKILNCSSSTFLGRKHSSIITTKSWGELFALVVHNNQELLKDTIKQILLEKNNYGTNNGKLWDLFYRLESTFTFEEIDDFTDDIDCLEDLTSVLPIIKNLLEAEI